MSSFFVCFDSAENDGCNLLLEFPNCSCSAVSGAYVGCVEKNVWCSTSYFVTMIAKLVSRNCVDNNMDLQKLLHQ